MPVRHQSQVLRHWFGQLALAAAVVGCCLFTWPVHAAEHRPWELHGTVVTESGAPAVGVSVTVRNLRFTKTVVTKVDGGFVIIVPEPRAWGFSIVAKDAGGGHQASFALPAGSAVDAPLGPIRLSLATAFHLPVTVVDKTGHPIEGAAVGAEWNYRLVDEVRTNHDGKAVLHVPRKEPLQIVFAYKAGEGLDYVAFRRPNQPPSNPYMRSPTDLSPVSFVLSGARPVHVRVVDNQGHGLAGMLVNPWYFSLAKKGEDFNTSGLDALDQTTDASGWANFRMIPSANRGKLTFWVRTEDYFVPERPMFDPAGAANDVTAVLVPLERVRGKVISSDGRPAPFASITVAGSGYAFDDFRAAATSDAGGAFEVRVAPDQYYMFVAKREGRISECQSSLIRAGSSAKPLNLVLEPATRVHGTVTVGKQNRPVTGQYISLYLKTSVDYYQLPKSEQLPKPAHENKAIFPVITEGKPTDDKGQYEFMAGPGRYYIIGPTGTKAPEFQIKVQAQVEYNFHTERAERGPITGRVVLKEHPDRGVAEARVDGAGMEWTHFRDLNAITDAQGKFAAERSLIKTLVCVTSADRSLSGIVEISGDDSSVTIPIGPCASVRGRLISEMTGAPVPRERIDYGVQIKFAGGTFQSVFGGSAETNAAGEFTLAHLVPGWKYEIKAVPTTRRGHQAVVYHHVATVEPKRPEEIELGEVKCPELYNPPTLEELTDEFFQGSQQRPGDRLARRLRDARLLDRRVLIFAAARESKISRQFVAFAERFTHYEDSQTSDAVDKALGNFAILPLDASSAEFNELQPLLDRLKLKMPRGGDATIAILDAEGRQLAETTGDSLCEKANLKSDRLLAFLNAHASTAPDGQQLLIQALDQAKREQKRVLLEVSLTHSEAGRALSRYLDDQRAVLEKDYVILRLDSRFANFWQAVANAAFKPHWGGTLYVPVLDDEGRVRKIPSHSDEQPSLVILDADGKTLATSNTAAGTIGYPAGKERVAHFEKMIRETASRLNNAEIQSLLSGLNTPH